ncbi:hypothetical protein [Tenacibaculum sp. 190524A05c]|uniref:hypothetical protein n=1 Tax=Tenacibaculum platacis TaxID=3137852 RepID=UPI0031FAACC5
MRLEKAINSLRLVTILMLLYVLGYTFKAYYLFYEALGVNITNENNRVIASLFSALIAASFLLVSYIHKDKLRIKNVSYYIFFIDVVMMLFILKVFESSGVVLFQSIFISVFYALIGLVLISIFKAKYKQELAEAEQKEAREELLEKHKCVCGARFENASQLNGHKAHCKIYKKHKESEEKKDQM